MEKVVHIFEIFKIIFYFKFLELRKIKFGSIKVWKNLNIFKLFEILKRARPPRGDHASRRIGARATSTAGLG
jgi:hypothetical protein